ncbi:MAG: hypothetical protein PHU49_01000 [Syntrophorhabdaceae bacterium]|nr:hypothetical protein [Syntrophorhabdaceae bacterium]MDD5242567.1 hypothetical protein [Syntrophorhabdaceae bacterium]
MDVTIQQNGVQERSALKRFTGWARSKRHIFNIVLACAAVALEIYYSICAGACSYLSGSILGINLEYVGIAYMAAIIFLSILKKDTLLLVLLSAGVGIEFYLIGFQVWYNTYCPYCLAFAAIIFILFLLNAQRDRKMLSVVAMGLALILFSIFFKGSVAPSYAFKVPYVMTALWVSGGPAG